MNPRLQGRRTIGAIVAAAVLAALPLMARADEAADKAEIAKLKQEIYKCHHHPRRHHRRVSQIVPRTIEKQVVVERTVEKPVYIEKTVEKPVYIERQIEQQAIVEEPVVEQRVVVEHSKHRRHLLHFGLPFLGSVTLF